MDLMRLTYLLALQATILLSFLEYHVSAQESGSCDQRGQDVVKCTCNGGNVNCSGIMLRAVPEITDKSISSILLSKNAIETISVSDFKGFANLDTLDLSFNSISTIDNGGFAELLSLKTLLLNGNELEELGPQHFRGLGKLWTLWLDNNQHLTIDACMFLEVPSLKTLNLHKTRVDLSSELVAPVRCPTSNDELVFANITSLSIGYEGTSSETSQLKNFPNLSSLTLYSFNAQSFGGSNLSVSCKLEELVLKELPVFPTTLISTSLTSLSVLESSFSCLPAEALANLPSLQIFRLISTDPTDNLGWIDEAAFKGAHNLTNITIFSNRLMTLPFGVFDDIGNSTHFPELVITSNNWDCCRSEWLQGFLSTDPRLNPNNTHTSIRCQNPFFGKELNEVNLTQCDGNSIAHGDSAEICNVRPTIDPTFEPPVDLLSYYIAVSVAVVALLVVNLILVSALCWVCKFSEKPPEGHEKDHSGPHENGGQDLDDDEYWGSLQVDDFELGNTDVRIYDFAPTQKEVMALKAGGSLPVRGSSTADWGEVNDLDFGPSQRSSAYYVNGTQNDPKILR